MTDISALENEIAATTNLYDRIDRLNELAFAIRFSQFERAVTLSEEAYTLSIDKSRLDRAYPKGKAESLINLSWFNADRANYEAALEQATDAFEIFRELGDPLGEARSLRLIGRSHMYLGNYLGSLECHLDQLSVSQESANREGEASALNALGTLYTRLEEHDEAIRNFRRAQEIYQDLNLTLQVGFAHINCAICYQRLGKLTEAFEDAEEGLRIALLLDSLYTQTWANNIMGDIYAAQEQYDKALSHFHQSLNILHNSENSQQWVDASISAGRLYTKRNQPEEALKHLRRALEVAEERHTKPDQHRCHEALAAVYKLQDNFAASLHHFEQFHKIQEDAINQETSYRLRYLDAQHRIETAEKETEIYQLRNVELKQEIEIRTEAEAALIDAKERAIEAQLLAERASQAKSVFLSNMSHELRTPLNAILGFGQLLQMDEALTEEQLESIDMILSSGNHLLALINEILDLSKIEAGRLELKLEPCTIAHVIDSAVNLVQVQAQAKGLNLEVNSSTVDPELFLLDETRLSQVLVNLLHNAVKFTNKGWVNLTVSPADRANQTDNEQPSEETANPNSKSFRFEISDSGVGMSEEELEMIFRPFEQVGHASAQRQGTGLGLAITKRIVALMGGELTVQSKVAEGSQFYFEIEFEVL